MSVPTVFYDGLALCYLAALPPGPSTKKAFIIGSHVRTALLAFRLKILFGVNILLSPLFAFLRELEGISTITPKPPGGIIVTAHVPGARPWTVILGRS